eukprot:6181273-Pleurochrysis_carterae.AAC.1
MCRFELLLRAIGGFIRSRVGSFIRMPRVEVLRGQVSCSAGEQRQEQYTSATSKRKAPRAEEAWDERHKWPSAHREERTRTDARADWHAYGKGFFEKVRPRKSRRVGAEAQPLIPMNE